MTLLDAILLSNRRAIFATCLDSRLRFVLQVIVGLPLPNDRSILMGSRRRAMPVRWTQGGHSSTAPKSE